MTQEIERPVVKAQSEGLALKLAEGAISDEALAELRRRIGTKLRIGHSFNELACRDSIRKFVDGIGDPNPLWRDEAYAWKTSYKGLVAPPSWLYSVFPTWVGQGLPGVHGFHSGNDWEFLRPVRPGDSITPECVFTGFEEKRSRFSGRMVVECQEARYYNQRQELLARAGSWIVRSERRAAREKGKYAHLQLPHPWNEEELSRLEAEVLAEEVRGSAPRYWEDVEVGEEVGPVVKGPLGLTDMLAFYIGCSVVPLLAHSQALRLYRRHPAWAFRHPDTLALESVNNVHLDRATASSAGLPYPFDEGVQRNCWLIQLLTHWMGDDGWLKTCYAEYRRFVYMSDAVWLRGRVTRKYFDEQGEACVDIETSAINQRSEDTMPGRATVILPSRDRNTWPVKLRVGS